MTPDKIRERINQLASEREQLIARIQAITGAMQDCEYWLAEIGGE